MITPCNNYLRKRQESVLRDECYGAPCPHCGAGVGEPCRSGNRTYQNAHRSRRPGHEFKPEPAWVNWWKAQRVYEGEYGKPRPAAYRVPSQAEILRGAA